MIDEKREREIRQITGFEDLGHEGTSMKAELLSEIDFLRERLQEYQSLLDSENGKANLLTVIALGRWAKQYGIPALKSARGWVVTHAMQTYSQSAAKDADMIDSTLGALPPSSEQVADACNHARLFGLGNATIETTMENLGFCLDEETTLKLREILDKQENEE